MRKAASFYRISLFKIITDDYRPASPLAVVYKIFGKGGTENEKNIRKSVHIIVNEIIQSEYSYGDLKGYMEWKKFLSFLDK